MKGCYIAVCLSLCICFPFRKAAAQSSEISRLQRLIHSKEAQGGSPKDSSYIDLLNAQAHAYYGINPDSVFYYAGKAQEYSESIGYGKGESVSWRMKGNGYELIGDYTKMLACYHQALTIASRIGNSSLIATTKMNIALFNAEIGKYEEAITGLEKIRPIYEKNGDSLPLANLLFNISDISFRQGQYDRALQYDSQALVIVRALKNDYFAAYLNNEVGKILSVKGLREQALARFRESMVYYTGSDNKLGITETSTLLANTLLLLKKYDEALRYAKEGLDMARDIKRKKQIRDAGKALADIYEAKGNYPVALQYFKLYKDFSDSLFNEETRKKTYEAQARYEFEKKESEMKDEQSQKDARHEHIVRDQRMQIAIAVMLIVSLSVLAFQLFRSKRDKQKANFQLRLKNEEIGRQKEEMELQKEEIEHQAVQLLLNNQEKDKLFSIIAHDLKGPLNSLKSLLDLLKENTLSATEIQLMTNELRKNVDYSAELVNNVLFWAGSQLNGIVVTPVVLHLQSFVEDLLNLFVNQAAEKKIGLTNGIEPSLAGFADKDMIQVVLRNLLSNAIKFCEPGDWITIRARIIGDAVEICVEDTGIGIKEEVLEKINRNESVSTYGTAKEKGTGLGLLLCREFTRDNNGNFRIESEWGKGSCFYFTIPKVSISSSINV